MSVFITNFRVLLIMSENAVSKGFRALSKVRIEVGSFDINMIIHKREHDATIND